MATVCMLLPPGPEQSSLMMILRRDWAKHSVTEIMKTSRNADFRFRMSSGDRTWAEGLSSSRNLRGPVGPLCQVHSSAVHGHFSFLSRRTRHQVRVDRIKLLRVDIELHSGKALVRGYNGRCIPE